MKLDTHTRVLEGTAEEFKILFGEAPKVAKIKKKSRKWSPEAKKRAAQKRLAKKLQPAKPQPEWKPGERIPNGPDGKPYKRRGRPPKNGARAAEVM